MSTSNAPRRIPRALLARFACAFALCALIPASAYAQSGGVVTGMISDKQGLALPGVTLTLKNTESGVARDTVTTENGSYRFPAIPPGKYNLRAELQGFAPTEVTDLTLTIGLEIKKDITMEVQGVSGGSAGPG